MKAETTIRVARPTDHLDEVVKFYTEGVGLTVIGSFQNHAGFDGVMLGRAGSSYHLEFTHAQGQTVGRAPTEENLLVFYLPEEQEWRAAIDRMEAAGYRPVKSFNPYWDSRGRTFEDPDGYRIVLQHASWPKGC